MTDPRSFILRIYRRDPDRVSGVVEDPQTGARRPFSNAQMLWELVATQGSAQQAGSGSDPPSADQPKEREP